LAAVRNYPYPEVTEGNAKVATVNVESQVRGKIGRPGRKGFLIQHGRGKTPKC